MFTWTPKNLTTALLPSSVLNTILGFKIFKFPHGRRIPILTYIYTLTIICSLSIMFFAFEYKKCDFTSKYLLMSKPIFITIYVFNQLSGMVSLLITLLMSKEEEVCLERLELLNHHIEGYMLDEMYKKIFYHSVILNLANFCFNFVVPTNKYILIHNNYSFWRICYCSLYSELLIMIQMTIDLNFGFLIKLIGCSLKQINNNIKLEKKLSFLCNEFHVKRQRSTSNMIQIVKLQYMELMSIGQKINNIYKFQISISMVVNLLSIIAVLYVTAVTYVTKKQDSEIRIHFYLQELILFCGLFLKFIYVCSSCYNVNLEAMKTKEHLLYLAKDVKLQLEVNEFIEQIELCPIVFNVFGCKLNHQLIFGFILAVVDRLTLVMQLYPVD